MKILLAIIINMIFVSIAVFITATFQLNLVDAALVGIAGGYSAFKLYTLLKPKTESGKLNIE